MIVYFYPKDDTPGCTKEACNFRDSYHEFEKNGVSILGVSKDSILSHQKFATKYHLSFPLLSDPDRNIILAYEAWGEKKFMGKTFEGVKRITYVIDPQGKIRLAYDKVNPLTHASIILNELKSLF